ncbi:MAG: DUF983 domain-containing protein [Dehalococcoidia bacterium]|nr:DUF983 domain-containing protein [Dehalococcoidia bacterium]MCA9844447.1 DUF983 domain-containing protein [Dehalococcoidia bacterium]
MPERSIPGEFVNSLRHRCPRCAEGKVYKGFLSMHPKCPVCGLRFEREPGYFTGAMYASYTLGIILTFPVWVTLLVIGAPVWVIGLATAAEVAVLFPFLFRLSRVLWMHLDHRINPEPEASTR